MNEERFQELALKLARTLQELEAKEEPPPRPALRLVDKGAPLQRAGLDAITRESHIRMIGHLRKRYGLQVLVDQAMFGMGSLDRLSDDELVALHRDLERARECLADGISLEEAGLLRSRYG